MPARAPHRSPRAPELHKVPVLAIRDMVHFPLLVNTLHVVRLPSQRALQVSNQADRLVLILSQRDNAVEEPSANDLFRTGTLSEVLQCVPLPDGSLRVALRGLRRVKATRVQQRGGSFWSDVEELAESRTNDLETEALMRACTESFTRIVHLNKDIPPEALSNIVHQENPGLLADSIAHFATLRTDVKQKLLEELSQKQRLETLIRHLKLEEQLLELNAKVVKQVERELGDSHREFYLREQLKVIHNELNERDDRQSEHEDYAQRILRAQMPEAAHQRAMAELERLDRLPIASPEGMVLRNYLDCLVSLPWNRRTDDVLDLHLAEAILQRNHFGSPVVKERILDFLAVRKLTHSLRGPIVCFVGPPGVGKTSIGRSIAEALGRRYLRISLGGVRDEADIRGHRRTYVGSMPGRILQGLRDVGVANPVVVLDEIDKLGNRGQGDPAGALLEALDPEQNSSFTDHYAETPFDLSDVLFIATANSLHDIPAALLDRMEIIEFPGYTDFERREIGERFLFPRARAEHGLSETDLTITPDAMRDLVNLYTRESGVRGLGREIAAVCRKAARSIASGTGGPVQATPEWLTKHLGRPVFARNQRPSDDEVGIATGLVVSSLGGDTVVIEASAIPSTGEPWRLMLTGNLGDVMRESAQAALTYVRAHRPLEGCFDLHVHVAQGAVPKNGPSAGLTIAVAMASRLWNQAVRGNFAMTGEISLHGKVLPVGGVREKVLAALREGKTDVVLPAENGPDLEDLAAVIAGRLNVHLVESLPEALNLLLVPAPQNG